MNLGGFQSFVAWRYLMARPRRVSRIALWLSIICLVGAGACALAAWKLVGRPDPRALEPSPSQGTYYALLIAAAVAGALAVIAATFCVIRYYFTFFTTVPIGGVWIGTMALVIVLSVMSGFENDLQGKILGSNAHIQVTKVQPDDGEGDPFVEWKDVEAKIDQVPGVAASMPFATSEAVIAANNNYATVIIKGIVPERVGQVTHLVQDIEGNPAERAKAMKNLYPEQVDDVARPPVAPPQRPAAGAVDPAPADMPGGAEPVDFSGGHAPVVDPAPTNFRAPDGDLEPIDYSKPEAGAGSGSGAGSGADVGPATHPDRGPNVAPGVGSDFGGDARALVGLDGGAPPAGRDAGAGRGTGAGVGSGAIHTLTIGSGGDVIDSEPPGLVLDDEGPRESGRTALLSGILVGRELVKTIHMWSGEEVRVVSPLTDPSNPDATGTPIPYNRDFRVAGVFYTGMYEYDLKFVYVSLEALQEFLDLGDAVDGIEVRIKDPDATGDVGAAIARAIGPGYEVRDWKELNRNLFSALKLEKIAMFLVLAITILVASFSIIGNLIMVVVEKAKEIALLKTLGAGDRGVMSLFVTQGFFIGVIGTALGVVYGLLLCWACATWGLPLNPDVYYIDQLPIHVEASSVLAIAAAGILISVAATIYPAFVAARLRPAQGLRHD